MNQDSPEGAPVESGPDRSEGWQDRRWEEGVRIVREGYQEYMAAVTEWDQVLDAPEASEPKRAVYDVISQVENVGDHVSTGSREALMGIASRLRSLGDRVTRDDLKTAIRDILGYKMANENQHKLDASREKYGVDNTGAEL